MISNEIIEEDKVEAISLIILLNRSKYDDAIKI